MSNFGQLVAIFDFANRTISTGVNAAIEGKRIKGETKLGKLRIWQQGELSKLDIGLQREAMQAEFARSARRDEIFKEVALYAGLGIGGLVLVIALGAFVINRK